MHHGATSEKSVKESADELTTVHVRSAQTGDVASTEWIVDRFSPALLVQSALRMPATLRRHVEPEDVVQDAWLRALPRLPDLDPRDGRLTPVLLSFLATTILHRVNQLLARHARGAENGGEDAFQQYPEETVGVVTRAVRSEAHRKVLAEIDDMPARDREVLVLRGIELLSNDAAARVLGGVTPNHVAVLYTRALDRLRKRFPESVFADFES